VQRFARYCVAQGWRTLVVSFQRSETPDISVRHVAARPRSGLGGNWHLVLRAPAVARILREFRPTLIIAHYITSYGFIGGLLAGRQPLVLWGHGSDLLVTPKVSWLARLAARWALRRARAVVVVSPQLAEVARHLLPAAAGKTFVMPLGVDPRQFNRVGRVATARGPRCTALRGFVSNSQPLLVIEALRLVAERYREATLSMAGDGPLRPAAERAVAEQGLEGLVRFVGRVGADRVAGILRETDIYIAPTFSDGSSVSLLEAMACGACPVVSDTPANRCWIEDGVNGVLVSPTAPAATWAERLAWAWRENAWRQRAVDRNVQIVASRGVMRDNLDKSFEFAFERAGLLRGRRASPQSSDVHGRGAETSTS
jgi:L-malate glycosyltransferase